MTDRHPAQRLLELCTVRVECDGTAKGTAFFVAPGYAMTAAHVVGGALGLSVVLRSEQGTWNGRVTNLWPPGNCEWTHVPDPYPPPDVALIGINDGPRHLCAFLARKRPRAGAEVMALGHGRHFARRDVVAVETESFTLTGELSAGGAELTVLKLGHGQASSGMSGAPVLDVSTGQVIGMLRTSRDTHSNLGAWVVPAELIRRLLPDGVRAGAERFHLLDDRWRRALAEERPRSSQDDRPAGGLQIESISISAKEAGVVFGDVHGDVNMGGTGQGKQPRSRGPRGL